MESFGDKIYNLIASAKGNLFVQGESAELTYTAFNNYIPVIEKGEMNDMLDVFYPIGYNPDRTTMSGKSTYRREDLLSRYRFLAQNQLAINGIYQIVTIMEALFVNLLRSVLLQFPQKISKKDKITTTMVLEAESIEALKSHLVNSVINEIMYKSPKEFALEFQNYIGIKLLEIPMFLKYIELKATRDVYIHNQGMANETYRKKADHFRRVNFDRYLPVDIVYFLESYENCLQLTESLEDQFHSIWHSDEYLKSKQPTGKTVENQQHEAFENVVEKVNEVKANEVYPVTSSKVNAQNEVGTKSKSISIKGKKT